MDKDFKLASLLEITKAINSNLSSEKLLKLFVFVLKNQLKIPKACILNFQENKLSISEAYGTDFTLSDSVITDAILSVKDIKDINHHAELKQLEFDTIIPVFNEFEAKAYILLGDLAKNSKFNVSPIIKNLHFIQTLANVVVVAIENKKLTDLKIQREKQLRELELARQMQEYLIPKNTLKSELIDLSAFYKPFEGIGGDYYDFAFSKDQIFTFCVGDISGKGIAAALLMANLQAQFRAALSVESDLEGIVEQLNEKVLETTHGDKFVTLFIGRIDFNSMIFTYINAGHPPGFLMRAKKCKALKNGIPLLGVFETLPEMNLENIKIETGDVVTVCTDGIFEAENMKGQYFEENRYTNFLEKSDFPNMREMNLELMEAVQDFVEENPISDDIALLSFRIL